MAAQNSGPEQKKKGKPRGRPFPKNTSGNPGGRPKEEREVVEVLRMEGVALAKALLKLAKKGNVFAIKECFDRAYGKARNRVELTGDDGGPITINVARDTLASKLAARLRRNDAPRDDSGTR